MAITYDSSSDFITAVSLFAALEGQCLVADSPLAAGILPYLGRARAELTDYGQRLPSSLEDVAYASLRGGLDRLDELLTRMLAGSQDLSLTLRLHASRQILREGVAR